MDELLTTQQICKITGLSRSTIAAYANPSDKFRYYVPKLPVAEQRIVSGRVVNYYRTADFVVWWEEHQARLGKEA